MHKTNVRTLNDLVRRMKKQLKKSKKYHKMTDALITQIREEYYASKLDRSSVVERPRNH